MHPLDIISESPNLYILQKESNKTNFGGVLFLIYLILIILIIVYYILDYIENPKYIIQSFSHFNVKSEKEKEERKKNKLFNPKINFKLDLRLDKKGTELNNKVKLLDAKTGKVIHRNEIFQRQITEFNIVIFYECENSNYSDYYNYLKTFNKTNDTSFILYFEYEGFKLDHQNRNKPIKKKENGIDITFYRYYKLDLNATMEIDNIWRSIIYTEKKEIFGNDTQNGCGYIESYNSFTHDSLIHVSFDRKVTWHIYLGHITFEINNEQYTEYSRKRISELDLLANILSLIANIFTGVRFILRFYSNNFNNFKIIERLLNKQTQRKYKMNKSSEINDFENNLITSINDEETLTNNKDNNKNDGILNDDIIDDFKEDDELSTKSARIKKLHFFDFFLNNLYCCCKKQKPQKIIHTCNKIVYKYASIDNIIKNQILIENFLKDYKWNDPSLNTVENNELFIQLQTYL